MFIFPYVLAHSLLPHFSRFGPRLARFWGRGPFLDPPVLSDSACPSTSELLEPSINDYRSITIGTIGTIYSQVVSVDCRQETTGLQVGTWACPGLGGHASMEVGCQTRAAMPPWRLKLWDISSSRFLFWSLRAQQGARTLQNHFPACFFDGPHQSCKFGGLWTIFKIFDPKGWSCEESVVAAFFFDPSVPNKVQEHFKITSQLVFLMLPTTLSSFVQIGALWFFFVPRVPPLHHFSFLVAQTPTRCKTTSKSHPSLLSWWSPPVLQVSSRLEHFDFFFFQGSPLWIFFAGFW